MVPRALVQLHCPAPWALVLIQLCRVVPWALPQLCRPGPQPLTLLHHLVPWALIQLCLKVPRALSLCNTKPGKKELNCALSNNGQDPSGNTMLCGFYTLRGVSPAPSQQQPCHPSPEIPWDKIGNKSLLAPWTHVDGELDWSRSLESLHPWLVLWDISSGWLIIWSKNRSFVSGAIKTTWPLSVLLTPGKEKPQIIELNPHFTWDNICVSSLSKTSCTLPSLQVITSTVWVFGDRVWRWGQLGEALRIIRPVTVELFSYSAWCFLQDLSSDKITVRIFFIDPTEKHYIRFQGHTEDFSPF